MRSRPPIPPATSATTSAPRSRWPTPCRRPARCRSSRPPRRPTTRSPRRSTGFTDADGDALTYRYQWFRNGTAIPEATGRTLDLSQPGNGDLNDVIAVDVTALDGAGGTSATTRGSTTITGSDTHPVAAFGFEEAAGNAVANDAAGPDGTISGATRSNTGRFGRAL